MKLRLLFIFAILAFVSPLFAQDQPSTEPKKPVSTVARLQAAKTVFLKNESVTDIPFNVIQAGMESWPRYQIVNSPDKADIVLEVLAPEDPNSTNLNKDENGGKSSKKETSKENATLQFIRLTAMDARTNAMLFMDTLRPKNSWKEANRTQNEIECAQKLFTSFKNRVEPPDAGAAQSEAVPTPK
jgi:hypothetical protein